MQWSDGEALDSYIFNNIQLPARLSSLTKEFKDLCLRLQRSSVAHSDLQHGNIIIENGHMRLVDYDNFFVPALLGKKSVELGHPNYQHPKRTTGDFGAYLDNFSQWVVYTSLQCIVIDPRLWYELAGGDECLLFRSADFGDPCASYSFSLLESHRSEEVRRLSKQLRSFCDMSPEKIPSVNDALIHTVELRPLRLSTVPAWLKNISVAPTSAGAADSQRQRMPFRAVNEAVKWPMLNFEDQDLRQALCILEDTRIGRHGRVYHFICKDKEFAVKFFMHQVEAANTIMSLCKRRLREA